MTARPRDHGGRFVSALDVPRYRVTVWNLDNGDQEQKLWQASERELRAVEDRWADEPGIEIQIEDLP